MRRRIGGGSHVGNSQRDLGAVGCSFFLEVTAAHAGHCDRGSESERIKCLNAEVAYLTVKWKETLASVEAVRTEREGIRADLPKIVGAAIPNGVVLAWSMPEEAALPDGWVACDGEAGRPNLVGRFLRGDQKAGGSGGSDKHAHKVYNDGGRDGRGFAVDNSPMGLGNTDEQSNLPPFANVVFLCRQ